MQKQTDILQSWHSMSSSKCCLIFWIFHPELPHRCSYLFLTISSLQTINIADIKILLWWMDGKMPQTKTQSKEDRKLWYFNWPLMNTNTTLFLIISYCNLCFRWMERYTHLGPVLMASWPLKSPCTTSGWTLSYSWETETVSIPLGAPRITPVFSVVLCSIFQKIAPFSFFSLPLYCLYNVFV